jgi:hypothetical protein
MKRLITVTILFKVIKMNVHLIKITKARRRKKYECLFCKFFLIDVENLYVTVGEHFTR